MNIYPTHSEEQEPQLFLPFLGFPTLSTGIGIAEWLSKGDQD